MAERATAWAVFWIIVETISEEQQGFEESMYYEYWYRVTNDVVQERCNLIWSAANEVGMACVQVGADGGNVASLVAIAKCVFVFCGIY